MQRRHKVSKIAVLGEWVYIQGRQLYQNWFSHCKGVYSKLKEQIMSLESTLFRVPILENVQEVTE